MLAPTIVIITSALVFYSIGIWAERLQGTLKPWHAAFFALGLVADSTGTFLMTRIAGSGATLASPGLVTLMGITGTIALLLMAVHLVWAIVVLRRNRPQEKATFHRFSLAVWTLWLIPYVAGAAASMAG